MGREIKFRAWDGVEVCFDIAVGRHPEDTKDCRLLNSVVIMDGGDCWYEHEQSEIIEQFTGLKDVNGVEIYEGDIVRVLYSDGLETSMTFAVEFFGIRDEDESCLKVIGNIHQNPELLEITHGE